jgi:hypothetical protein
MLVFSQQTSANYFSLKRAERRLREERSLMGIKNNEGEKAGACRMLRKPR